MRRQLFVDARRPANHLHTLGPPDAVDTAYRYRSLKTSREMLRRSVRMCVGAGALQVFRYTVESSLYRWGERNMAYFFVIGSARSGGSLVYAILSSDPATNPLLHENHFVAMAASAYSSSRTRLRHEKGQFFADVRDTQEFFSGWITSFLEKIQLRYAPAKHLVIKSTLLSAHCPDLYDVVPSARFVMSVRDPRDIVASMIEVGKQQENTMGGRPNTLAM